MKKARHCVGAIVDCGAVEAETDPYKMTLQRCAEIRKELVLQMQYLLTMIVFGIVFPALLMVAPLLCWNQLCSLQWVGSKGQPSINNDAECHGDATQVNQLSCGQGHALLKSGPGGGTNTDTMTEGQIEISFNEPSTGCAIKQDTQAPVDAKQQDSDRSIEFANTLASNLLVRQPIRLFWAYVMLPGQW